MPIPHLRPNRRRTRNYGDLNRKNSRLKKHKNRQWWLKNILVASLIGGLVCFIAGTMVIAWISKDLPSPDRLADRQITQSTRIYDRSGEHLLYEIFQNQKRTLVNLDQISPWAIKATIAVEDKHFYEHKGVRLISIFRAAINNLLGRRTGSGGASTLTQQFIKKTMVGDERSLFRKIKEAILAIRLEKKYSKDDILKMYLNEIPYGSTNYGIETAAQSYFHKNAKDLDLPEAATLAAMIQAPSHYLNNPSDLRDRRDAVIRLMFEQNYISETEKNIAQNSALRIFRSGGIMAAPHFVLYIKQLLADQFGEKTVDTAGLKVITTLDYDKQMAAEKIIKENGDKFAKEAQANNAALVAIDPKTSQILAMVGSRDFEDETIDGQFNVAVLGKRQPGSSFKPFVYTAAFEKGYTPETVLYDISTNFEKRADGRTYVPKNYDNKEHGLVTMRTALQGSLNIASVKTLYLVGLQPAIDFAKRFGYTTLTGDYGLSLVLGGAEVTLLEHTNAYAALADHGLYHAPASILKVSDSPGNLLYEWKESPGQQATKPEMAALITDVLSDDKARAFIFGAHGNLTLPDRPVAAKTGTTNDNKDAWTLGYVPSLAAGVWVGNTIPSPMKGGGNKLAGVIWNQFMRQTLKDSQAESFPAPPSNDAQKPVLRGSDGGIKLPIDIVTGKIATSSTPPRLISERTFLPPHTILHYINRDDPRGPVPTNPAADPQYESWESALQDWVKRMQESGKDLVLSEPPTEYDSPQSAELAPALEVVSPVNGQALNSRQIEIRIKTTAPRGVYQVNYQIDGVNIGVSREFPFSLNYYARSLTRGTHSLKAFAEDDLGNSAAAEINFILDAEMDPPSIDWFDSSPLSITSEDFPRTFYLTPFRWDDIKEIKISLSSPSGKKIIYNFNPAEDKLFNNKIFFTWKHSPGSGQFSLVADLTDNSGRAAEKILLVNIK